MEETWLPEVLPTILPAASDVLGEDLSLKIGEGIYLDEGWFTGLVSMPFYVSLIICTFFILVFLIFFKQFSLYKMVRIIAGTLCTAMAGMFCLFAAVLGIITFIGAGGPQFLNILIPPISIALFFLVSRLVLKLFFKYFDNRTLMYLCMMVALAGNPVITFMWSFYKLIKFV